MITCIEPAVGRHIHNLTVYYGPVPKVFKFDEPVHSGSGYSLRKNKSAMIGHVHGDTKEFNDWHLIDKSKIRTRIVKLTVFYDEEIGVHGFQTTYDVAGKKVKGGKYRGSSYHGYGSKKSKIHLFVGEYITEVYGRVSDWIRQICFKTSAGRLYEFGNANSGDHFDIPIPPKHAVGALTGGINGHLHNLTVWYGKINRPGHGLSMVNYYTVENRFPKDIICGQTRPDTENFSDKVDYNSENYRLDSVKILADPLIIGIQCTYEVNGECIQGEKFFGSQKKLDEIEYEVKTLNLDIDEFITNVSGSKGDLIDNIKLVTNKGKVLEIGGDGGSPFDLEIPEGDCVGFINGGKNGHIHFLKFFIGPLPTVLRNDMKNFK